MAKDTLSFVEQEILYFGMQGLSTNKMHTLLKLTYATTETYRTQLIKKLRAKTMAQAIVHALRMDLIDLHCKRPIKDNLKIPDGMAKSVDALGACPPCTQ